jgi:CheY-like chemotaxis protein
MLEQSLTAIHVLVVDNDEPIRSLLAEALEVHGAKVTAVESAQEALDSLEALRPDVLVSDLEMPEKDGLWLISHVRALTPEQGGMTPAACLTGFTEPEIRATLLRAGFQYHIAKPVKLETLIGVVGLLALKI